jgi:hypothetical protein
MTTTEQGYICRVCGDPKQRDEMAMSGGRPARICKACNAAKSRALRRVPALRIDPCPACGVRQAKHWKCKRCTSRGHILRQSEAQPDLCMWCAEETT